MTEAPTLPCWGCAPLDPTYVPVTPKGATWNLHHMALTRLHSISPVLADAFRHASDSQKRNAVLSALVVAVSQTGLKGRAVDDALEILRRRDDGSELLQELESL